MAAHINFLSCHHGTTGGGEGLVITGMNLDSTVGCNERGCAGGFKCLVGGPVQDIDAVGTRYHSGHGSGTHRRVVNPKYRHKICIQLLADDHLNEAAVPSKITADGEGG